MENMKRNRILSLGDIERFISNFKCQSCESSGSYIITKELFQWIDQSLNVTFQCQTCNMSLRLTESKIIEVKTPGCISKTISHNMLQLACAAIEIGLTFLQIETLLKSLGIPTPTLTIWKTYVEIANERNKSNISDPPAYVKQNNEVEEIDMEAQSHNLSSVKTEKPDAVVDIINESNTIIIKEEPPELDIKEELGNKTNDELFMEYNDEVIVPDIVNSEASTSSNQLSRQTANEDTSDVIDVDYMEVSSSYNIETIYIEDRTSVNYTSTKNSSEDGISFDWNVNEVTKKRHVVIPKRYRDDFYCEDYRNKSSVNKKSSNNRYAAKNNLKMIRSLVSDSDADVEIITKSDINRIGIICALCGSCKCSNSNHHYSSIIPGFGSITVKVALQILNLPTKKPMCKQFCTPCFNYICTKFKYTLKKKIADQKNIDISEVMLSKIKVKMFDRLDKKNNQLENSSRSNEMALSTSSINTQRQKVVNLNSNNEVKLKRKKYLTKKMSESLSQKRLKIPYLTKQMEKDAKSSHPIIRLMDVSLILPSEAFDGASVSVDRKSDILQFCRKRS